MRNEGSFFIAISYLRGSVNAFSLRFRGENGVVLLHTYRSDILPANAVVPESEGSI